MYTVSHTSKTHIIGIDRWCCRMQQTQLACIILPSRSRPLMAHESGLSTRTRCKVHAPGRHIAVRRSVYVPFGCAGYVCGTVHDASHTQCLPKLYYVLRNVRPACGPRGMPQAGLVRGKGIFLPLAGFIDDARGALPPYAIGLTSPLPSSSSSSLRYLIRSTPFSMSADSHRLCCSSGIRKVSGNQRPSEAIRDHQRQSHLVLLGDPEGHRELSCLALLARDRGCDLTV